MYKYANINYNKYQNFEWYIKCLFARSHNEDYAEEWRKAILLASFKFNVTKENLSTNTLPTRRFFVLLNPVSGRRKAVKMYQKVKDLFFEADIGHKLIETTHAVSRDTCSVHVCIWLFIE